MANNVEQSFYMKEFENNIINNWKNLQDDEDFFDVTLACDDKHIRTHKLVIASGSLVLRNILKFSDKNPFIFLSGVKFVDLQHLLNFMYQGEANIPKENLERFLKTAENLKIIGLIENNVDHMKTITSLPGFESKSKQIDDILEETNQKEIPISIDHSKIIDDNETANSFPTVPGKEIINHAESINVDHESLPSVSKEEVNTSVDHSKYTPTIKKEELFNINENSVEKSYCCQICNKKFKFQKGLRKHRNSHIQEGLCHKCDYKGNTKKKLNFHVKSFHDGIQYICDQCAHKATTKYGLNRHIDSIHKGIKFYKGTKFPCTQCDYKSTKKSLKNHINTIHEGNYYLCDKCDYKTILNRTLQHHIKSMHLGIFHQCKQCDYKSNSSEILKKHIRTIHEGVRYPCSQCDYKAKSSTHLKRHTEAIHDNIRYDCNQCEYKATQKHYLSRHIGYVHNKK